MREAGDANVALAEYGDKGGIVKGRKACESDGRRKFLLASDNLFLVPCKNLLQQRVVAHVPRNVLTTSRLLVRERIRFVFRISSDHLLKPSTNSCNY